MPPASGRLCSPVVQAKGYTGPARYVEHLGMHVISASYRTDIPAFYGEWFLNRIRAGAAAFHNPYSGQLVPVSLRPEDVRAIVFWSKNYGPFLRYLNELDDRGYRCYFHYSITGYTAESATHLLEERVPSPVKTLESFRALAERSSPRHVQWRYDPIILSPLTDESWHLRTFRSLAERLAGLTTRCYISFVDLYDKVSRNLEALCRAGHLPREVIPHELPDNDKIQLAGELARVAHEYGITVYTCAEDVAAQGLVRRGSCVDQEILDELWPEQRVELKLSSNRGKCGCYDSRDIGAYDTCPQGCVYCYAVRNRPQALARYRDHEPQHYALIRRPSDPVEPPWAIDEHGVALLPPQRAHRPPNSDESEGSIQLSLL